jgi:hypothetical protein
MLSGKAWSVHGQPMTLATRPHASRLWPTCGALLVNSFTLLHPPTLLARADEVIE